MAFFDGLSLFREEFGQTYTYDEDGNIISVVDAQKEATEFEYNCTNDMTGIIDAKGNKFTYVYDSRHNVTKGTSAQGVVYKLAYDSAGNVTKSGCVDPAAETNGIWMERTLTSDKNHVSAVTDAQGNRVEYTWDTSKDLLTAMKDGRGSTISYGYDSANRLTSVSQDVTMDGETKTVSNTYAYTDDKLSSISHNGFQYAFAYDAFGNTLGASIAGTEVVGYTYDPNNGNLLKTLYGNGDYIRYTYDDQDRLLASYVKKPAETEETLFNEYVYDRQGNLAEVTNHPSGKTYTMSYDLLDRLMGVTDEQGNAYDYTYDAENHMTELRHRSGTGALVTTYTYDKDGREVTTKAGSYVWTTEYDSPGRVTGQGWGKVVRSGEETEDGIDAVEPLTAVYYDYAAVTDTRYEALPTALRIGSTLLSYEYDANGNITEIGESDLSTGAVSKTYVYDELNQLIRENDEIQGKSFAYRYDQGGNLQSVKEYAYTTGTLPESPVKTATGTYDATWKDKLLTWDGTAMTYDAIGNMLTKGSTTFSWQGRKLMGVENGKSIRYSYDHTGARTKKVVDSVITEYRMAGDLLVSEKIQDPSQTSAQTYWYRYDSCGNLVSATMGGLIYFYVKNLQGDIIAMTDNTGAVVVRYTYNSWGKLLSITGSLADTIGVQNPFRYRGYYYDNETGMYYLKNRYYDPELRRFICADTVGALLVEPRDLYNKNLYAYCDNNTMVRHDVDGEFWQYVVGAAVNVASTYISAKVTGQTYTWKDMFVAAASGAAAAAHPIIGGIVSGIYAGYVAIEAGASAGEVMLNMAAAAYGTTAIGGVGGFFCIKNLSNLTNAALGMTFGTGGNLISSAINAEVTRRSSSSKEVVEMTPIRKNATNNKNNYRLMGYGYKYNGKTGRRIQYAIYQKYDGSIIYRQL